MTRHHWIALETRRRAFHCYGCGDTLEGRPAADLPLQGCLPITEQARRFVLAPEHVSRRTIAFLVQELTDELARLKDELSLVQPTA